MTKQKIGNRAWEYSYVDGRHRGFYFCVGYCPKCKTKQVIERDEIKQFNKNCEYKLIPRLEWLAKLFLS